MIRAVTACVALACFAGPPAGAVTSPGTPQGSQERRITRDEQVKDAASLSSHTNIALLVGIGDYDRSVSGLAPLKYPVTDIAAVAKVLKAQGYEVAILTDTAATAGAIRESFHTLSQYLDKGQGTFLFYFAGHGFHAGSDNYLATFGTTSHDLAGQGLSMTEVQNLLLATGAERRMAFIDACRNDPDTRSTALRTFGDFKDAKGLRILYSTAPGEVSYEDEELQHGEFSYFVAQGLQGAAASSDGFISFDDLDKYVTHQMKSYNIPRRRMQMPYQLGDSTGDFLVGKKLAEVASIQPPVTPQQTPVQPQQMRSDGQDHGPLPDNSLRTPNSAAKGIDVIGNTETAKSVQFLWGSDYHRGLVLRFRIDSDAIYMFDVQGNPLTTLYKKSKRGKDDYYEGDTGLAPASGCPGGRGTIQIMHWNENRLDGRIMKPIVANGQVSCGGAFGLGRLLGGWQPVTFVKR